LELRNLRKCFIRKILCFNPHRLFGVGNVEQPNDYERAASLKRHTQLTFENVMLHASRQQSNTLKASLVGMGNVEQQFCHNIHDSPALSFKFGKSTPAHNPVPPLPSILSHPRSLVKISKRSSLEQTKSIAGFILPRMTGNQILDRI